MQYRFSAILVVGTLLTLPHMASAQERSQERGYWPQANQPYVNAANQGDTMRGNYQQQREQIYDKQQHFNQNGPMAQNDGYRQGWQRPMMGQQKGGSMGMQGQNGQQNSQNGMIPPPPPQGMRGNSEQGSSY